MEFFAEIEAQVAHLREVFGATAETADLGSEMSRLTDVDVVSAMTAASAIMRIADRVVVVGAGICAARSAREAGQSGLAQSLGHRNAASLVQDITGATRGEATRHVRVGESLLDDADGAAADQGDPPFTTGRAEAIPPAASHGPGIWHAGLGRALLEGSLTAAQHDAIRRGLGEPPVEGSGDADPRPSAREGAVAAAEFESWRELWAIAAEQLLSAAATDTPEMLAASARAIRDQLDPEGAVRRYQERFERRSFRIWTTADGDKRGSLSFDDDGYAWAQTIIASAMRPRTGGPRFVDADEIAQAKSLSDDPRTNDQLTYDLFLDLLRAGALADAETVFGARQAGVRLVHVVGDDGAVRPVAHTEDGLNVVPASFARQRACDAGVRTISVDTRGNPLNVGRTQRLFTATQRLALAIRDGGCRWPGCDRPASYCESHHIDPYSEGGRTDIDRGILLCRFHHLQLHHSGWCITREGRGDFLLHPPRGAAIPLPTKPALRYAWAGIDPPPRRFRPAA